MKFRYARHTNNLNALTRFYTEVIGLELLGTFENHDNYNGIFLGYPSNDWHLEFTQSNTPAQHSPDEDDLLVFYVSSREEVDAIQKDAAREGSPTVVSKNPYWQQHGVQINDPDGYGVIVTVKDMVFVSKDPITQLFKQKDIATWIKHSIMLETSLMVEM